MDWGSIGGAVGKGLLEVVLPSLATVIAAQAVKLLARQSKKVGLEISEAEQDKLRQVIVDAVTRAEEMGRRGQMSGEQKRIAATDAILAELRAAHPDAEEFTRERVGKMIDTVLPAVRPLISDASPASAA